MEIRIRATGQVVTESGFREMHENVSFPAVLNADLLDEFGADPVMEGAQPIPGPFQSVYREGVEQNQFGWFVKYSLRDWPQEEIDAYKASGKMERWEAIKAERERRKTSGFSLVVNGVTHWFHSDTDSKVQHFGNKDTARDQFASGSTMDSALLDPTTGQQILWKTLTPAGTPEVWLPLTCQLAFDIVKAGKAAEFAHHRIAAYHKQQMEASNNPSTYDFSGGWTPIFGE